MTTDSKLMALAIIAAIINTAANIVGPLLPVLVQRWMSHPTPTPVENQPKNRIHRIGGWLQRLLVSNWTYWLLWFVVTILFIYFLLAESRNPAPLTRGSVIQICVYVAALGFHLMNAQIHIIGGYARKSIDSLVEISRLQRSLNESFHDVLKSFSEAIHTIVNRLPPQQENALDKMLKSLKRLIGSEKPN